VNYYSTSLEERFFHENHKLLKPSGVMGHGLGIVGTLLILIGVFSYMARKRYRFLSRIGVLKHWLEFHIFLCILGPIMILFHTAFKFGGIVSVSFWSMVAVVASGVIGRYIYLQIPRTIQGRELTLNEVRNQKSEEKNKMTGNNSDFKAQYEALLATLHELDDYETKNSFAHYIRQNRIDRKKLRLARKTIKTYPVSKQERKKLLKTIKLEIKMNRKIERLGLMQNLFKYWHIAHLPFALIMLVIMVIHVVITLMFGYRWIF
jgi:hypothetical protein